MEIYEINPLIIILIIAAGVIIIGLIRYLIYIKIEKPKEVKEKSFIEKADEEIARLKSGD
ncbi:hypothetical protein LCGC14_0531530 [marine sediment metagenome]|uniref:Uncharacterized protein n=1 Tax=marine sediment metagenome TaxID=412755 RepID=A0A0F9SDY0_9ZZZZ